MGASRRPAFDIISHSPDQTRGLGALLGTLLPRGSIVLLGGGLGAGKTTFVQGLARPLKTGDQIHSPTFTIVSEHAGTGTDGQPIRLYHIDLYRLEGVADIESFGLDEYLDDPDGLVVIEWPERARWAMPEEHLLIDIEPMSDTKRNVRLIPRGRCYVDLVSQFRSEVAGGRS